MRASEKAGRIYSCAFRLNPHSAAKRPQFSRTVFRISAAIAAAFLLLISQYGAISSASSSDEEVPAAGDILNIQFSTNVEDDELAIYGSATWLTQDVRTRSTNSYIVSLRALPNTDKSSRTAYILFYKETEGTQTLLNTVTIVQEGTASGTSTDYSADKQVRILQQASLGKGLPIVIMGDGFIDTDIADGTYDTVMDKTLENLFTEEPLKSLRDYFNVYAITAVSKNNNFGSGFETAFRCELEGGNSTGISGNDEVVMEYVESIEGVDLEATDF